MKIVAQKTARSAMGRRRAGHKGFTLIEMLIVIGIILILVTIGVIGYRSMERNSAISQTKTTLAGAEGMLKNLNGAGSPNLIEGAPDLSPTPIWTYTGTGYKAVGQPGAATNTNTNIIKRPSDTGYPTNYQRVMQILLSIPQNKTAIASLPTLAAPAGTAPFEIPMLADAWGGPIIYVPAGGLQNVRLESMGATNNQITSTGIVGNAQNRPFFASAGPDGNFQTGDDNMYSFQTK